MSNYPAGAENDPNAPWNQDDSFELDIEKVESQIRGDLADELTDALLNIISEYSLDDDMSDIIYDNIYDDLKKVWENI